MERLIIYWLPQKKQVSTSPPHYSIKRDVKNLFRIQVVLEGLAAYDAVLNLADEDFEGLEIYTNLMKEYSRNSVRYKEYEKSNTSFYRIIWDARLNERLIELPITCTNVS